MKAEDLFGQLSLKGLQLRQQTVVENPRLGPIQKARKNTMFDFVHRGKQIELAVEDTTASGKESSPSFLYVVIYPLIQERLGDHHPPRHLAELVSGICSCPVSI